MERSLAVLGGSGDLTGLLLLPSRAQLYERGVVDDDVEVLAVGRQDGDDEAYRDGAADEVPLRDHPAGSAGPT